ncbi:hypothetical protein F4553_003054 [Allocatelliglobosispora scoriae]|uniref:Uncharacterized protein n=1 Tax=Allocatelliglobosispora scoriae TaxID=643052 RepID=A0A841BPR4_9ACTN|nr:hypothetical protein [Allocatelliglobosispora scoriae]MBB5869675.1 hypothetical protein [Allocatelliglobosispora scoriae]
MTTLFIPDSVTVSADVLAMIATALGVPAAQLALTGPAEVDLKAGGWLYERVDDENTSNGPADRVIGAGVTGFALGTRWSGGAR